VETLSPELALVDEALATAARARLPSPPDVFAVVDRRRAAERELRERDTTVVPQTPPAPLPLARPRPRRRRFVEVGLVACVLAAAGWTTFALAAGDNSTKSDAATATTNATPTATAARSRSGENRRSSKTARRRSGTRAPSVGVAVSHVPARSARSTTHPPTRATRTGAPAASEPPAAKPEPTRTSSKPKPPARLLNWPRRPGATYYRVQIFHKRQGTKPVFLFEVWTSQPKLALPSTWVDGGRHRHLGPGSYDWVVYPVFGESGGVGTGASPSKSIARGTVVLGGRG
jgi:hypothetical protein